MGEMARLMGKSNHDEHDDFAAGVLLRHGTERDDSAISMFVNMISQGIDPDIARKLLDN